MRAHRERIRATTKIRRPAHLTAISRRASIPRVRCGRIEERRQKYVVEKEREAAVRRNNSANNTRRRHANVAFSDSRRKSSRTVRVTKMVSGGMTCVKYLLFLFNLIFAVSNGASRFKCTRRTTTTTRYYVAFSPLYSSRYSRRLVASSPVLSGLCFVYVYRSSCWGSIWGSLIPRCLSQRQTFRTASVPLVSDDSFRNCHLINNNKL